MTEYLPEIVSSLVVIGVGALVGIQWRMNAHLNKRGGRDDERWSQNAERWSQNEKDHEKAFAKIDELDEKVDGLTVGQAEMTVKLDTLLERGNG